MPKTYKKKNVAGGLCPSGHLLSDNNIYYNKAGDKLFIKCAECVKIRQRIREKSRIRNKYLKNQALPMY
jgi:hypothetical protein